MFQHQKNHWQWWPGNKRHPEKDLCDPRGRQLVKDRQENILVRKQSRKDSYEMTFKKDPREKTPRKDPRENTSENRRTKGRPLDKTDEIMRKTISLLDLFCLTYLYILSKIFLKTAVFWTHSNNPHSSLRGTTAWNDQQDTKRVIHSTTIILIYDNPNLVQGIIIYLNLRKF